MFIQEARFGDGQLLRAGQWADMAVPADMHRYRGLAGFLSTSRDYLPFLTLY